MVRIIAKIGVLIATFTILLVLIRVVGRAGTNLLTALFSEMSLPDGQMQACWHGICPGQTTLDDARNILRADNTLKMPDSEKYPLCWESHTPYYVVCLGNKNSRLVSIQIDVNFQFDATEIIEPASRLKLVMGDVVAMWGHPLGVEATRCGLSSLQFGNKGAVRIVWVQNIGSGNTWTLDPNRSEVASFTLSTQSQTDAYTVPTEWKGFITTYQMECR